jgi:uncharacterized protein
MDSQPRKPARLRFRRLEEPFAICKLAATDPAPAWAPEGVLTSITRTLDELSIVCPLKHVPEPHRPEIPWFCLKLEGPFAFSEVGIVKAFIDPLVMQGIPIFVVSTYDTDYVLVQETFSPAALQALEEAGHELIE